MRRVGDERRRAAKSTLERCTGARMNGPSSGHVLRARSPDRRPNTLADAERSGPGRTRRRSACRDGSAARPDLDVVAGSGRQPPGPPDASMTSTISSTDAVGGVDHDGVVGLDAAGDARGPGRARRAGRGRRRPSRSRGRRPPCDRRSARTSGSAVRYTLSSASGNTTVPMSRPSTTPPPRSAAHSRWRRTHLGPHRRVGGHDAHRPGHLGPADLDGGVDAVDGDRRRPDVELEVARRCGPTGSASAGSMPRRRAAKVTARYMAPVSR